MNKLLEVKELSVAFPAVTSKIIVADKVTFSVDESEIVVLAGESGSGKTISSLAITRILPQSARIIRGSVLFEGRDLLREPEEELVKVRGRKISYIFQEPAAFLNPVYTIGYQIEEAIIRHQGKDRKSAYKEACSLLERVRILDAERVINSYPHQLSGGMNQRVFIAMSLACSPKLLIADEPTTSLDVTTEAEILKLLLELKKEQGFSLLFITHNLSIAKRIADRVYIMYRGKIVEEAGRQGLFESPKHLHTRELIASYEKIGRVP